jgi:8-oxo-dGTP pyrophosphatase MutT (NUDIX family)
VYKRTRSGIYVALLKDSFGKWTFPKGHVRRGETNEQGAAREIREEMGIRELRLKMPLGSIDIWFRDRYVYRGKLIHKYIHYFLFETPSYTKLRMPRPVAGGEKIQAVRWIPLVEVQQTSTYKDMKPIIKKAVLALEELDKHTYESRIA